MKIAVISDIHSNYLALQKFYEYVKIHKINKIIFLGDYVTDCPYPNKTMEIIFQMKKEFECFYILGNREEYLLQMRNIKIESSNSTNGSLLYTLENLDKKYLDFFTGLPIYDYLYIPSYPTIFFAHSTDKKTRVLLRGGSEETKKYMSQIDAKYILCGHSHSSFFYQYQGKKMINPGSFGIPNGKTVAEFCVLETNNDFEYDVKFLNLSYDVNILLKDFVDSGLVQRGQTYTKAIMDSFITKNNFSSHIISKGFELAERENALISEIFFERSYSYFNHHKLEQKLFLHLKNSLGLTKVEVVKLFNSQNVRVNGEIKNMSYKVQASDCIEVNGEKIAIDKNFLYYAYYKPKGLICSNNKNLSQSIQKFISIKERVYPIGRLDKDSCGLIILTNDGVFANDLIHSDSHVEKEYFVQVDKKITEEFILKMQQGVYILKQMTRPCRVYKEKEDTFRIILTQGLNRQIRRMCRTLGYEVLNLKRIRIGKLELDLEEGELRELKITEVVEKLY